MVTDYETRTTRIVVLKRGAELFDDSATTIEIDDESAGEFVKVSQSIDHNIGAIVIDVAEWPHIRDAIDRLAAECRG